MTGTRTMAMHKDRGGISAIYDALLALIIIMVATGAIYQMVVSSMARDSERAASEDMDGMADVSLPLVLDVTGHPSYGNLSNGTEQDLGLLRTKDMLELGLVLLGLEERGAAKYDLRGLNGTIATNCRLILWGWHWAIEAYGVTGPDGVPWSGPGLFIAYDGTMDAKGVPDPRSVNTMTVCGQELLMEVRLYVWT
jgi:hypothetical protein